MSAHSSQHGGSSSALILVSPQSAQNTQWQSSSERLHTSHVELCSGSGVGVEAVMIVMLVMNGARSFQFSPSFSRYSYL